MERTPPPPIGPKVEEVELRGFLMNSEVENVEEVEEVEHREFHKEARKEGIQETELTGLTE